MNERALGATEYLLGFGQLAAILVPLAYAAFRLRRELLPGWSGAPALVADLVAGITLATLLAEILGTFGAFTDVGYGVGAVAVAALVALAAARLGSRSPQGDAGPSADDAPPAPPGPRHGLAIVAVVSAAVVAGWAIPTLTGIAGGMGRADSLWYHMPLSARFVETGSTGELFFFDPIFFASFYPANSEVFHAIPILAFARDFVSPLLNMGFLWLGLLASWAIGRPYGLGPHALLGGAVVLGAETMIDFQAGEALNDITGVAFLLCAVALLVNGHAARGHGRSIGWAPLAFAGAAAGLAAGTKLSFLAPVALLTIAVVVVAPRAARARAGAAWSVPMLAAGGYWYARNLVTVGNPIPYTEFGPLGLAAPERAFELRPGFAVVHYWNDPGVWFDWFVPKLTEELGPLWPLVLVGVVAGSIYAIWRGHEPILRALGGVALVTAIAYVFTPLTAGGEEGEPIAFEWNVRYLAPAIAIGLAILPLLPAFRATERRRLVTLGALATVAFVTAVTIVQWPEGGHTKGGLAAGFTTLALFAVAARAHRRRVIGPGAARGGLLAVGGGLALTALVAGFVVQRHYLERRYENLSPQLNIAEAVRWANGMQDERIAISGIRGVFNQYAFSGFDLSNHVQWLGIRSDEDAFLRIPDCETWREEVNAGGYSYVVTMYDPYLPGGLTDTKEALWTREDPHAEEVVRDGPVSVFKVNAPLDPDTCGDLPDLEASELNGESANLDPLANQPPPGLGTAPPEVDEAPQVGA